MTVGLLDVLSLLKSWVLPVLIYSGFVLGGTGIQQGRQAREKIRGEKRGGGRLGEVHGVGRRISREGVNVRCGCWERVDDACEQGVR